MDHSKHTPMTDMELKGENLEGVNVYGPGDEKIGSVSHLHGTPPGAQAVIDVGGFLGMGAKPVGMPMSSLNFMRAENGTIHATTLMTKEQLKDMPEHRD